MSSGPLDSLFGFTWNICYLIRSDRPVKIQFAAGHCGRMSHTSKRNCGHGNRHMTLYGVKGGSTARFGHEMDLYPGREGGVDHPRYAEKFMLTPV